MDKVAFSEACRRGDLMAMNRTLFYLLTKATPYVFNQYLELMNSQEVDPRLRSGICQKLASSEETLDEAIVFFDRYPIESDTRSNRKAILLQLAKSRDRVEVIRRLIQGDVAFEVFEAYLLNTEYWFLNNPDVYQTLFTKFYPLVKNVVEQMIKKDVPLPLIAFLGRFGDIVHYNLQAYTSMFCPQVLDQWIQVMKNYKADLIPRLQEFLSEGRFNSLYTKHPFLTEGLFPETPYELIYPILEVGSTFTYDALKYWVDKGRNLDEVFLMDHIPKLEDKYKVWSTLISDERVRQASLIWCPELRKYVNRVIAYTEQGLHNDKGLPREVAKHLRQYLM